jgi:hypothetical protein
MISIYLPGSPVLFRRASLLTTSKVLRLPEVM